jgi:hypothetical protein
MNKTINELANWSRRWPVAGAVLAVLVVAFGSLVLGAKGGIQGPPVGGESPNNLSVPGVQTMATTVTAAYWAPPGEPLLGVHYSYGCDVGESDGQFSYPNTSCVDSLSEPTVYYTAEQCTDDVLPSPCQGMAVERIYWQKVESNEWWADDTGVSPNVATVDYVDWGDALEAVSWTETSVIRVETQPWTETIDGFNPMIADPTLNDCAEAAAVAGLDPSVACKIGLQMWHVSGQGITEHWGVRAVDAAPFDSFNYDTPFQIVKSTEARLNLTKLEPGSAVCSMPGGNPGDDPPEVTSWNGSGWDATCEWYDEEYSVETSVGGKFVFGYNWRMRDVELESLCGPDWEKTGFWRLTFYAPQGDVIFDDAEAPNVAPSAVPVAMRALPRSAFITTEPVPAPEPEEGEDEHEHEAIVEAEPVVVAADTESEDPSEDDRLYRPVVDVANNLSYIDVCIRAKTIDGGGGGGGGGPGGGGHVDTATQTDAVSHTGGGGRGGGRGGGGDDHGDH